MEYNDVKYLRKLQTMLKWRAIQDVSFILFLITAALSHRKPASTGTYSGTHVHVTLCSTLNDVLLFSVLK